MDKTINEFLKNLKFGECQVFKNMAVIPLFSGTGKSPDYLTMKEAMDKNYLTIKEVDSSGSVPHLNAINKAELPVLILDGEEIIGAKQNRVLNTTVLLKEESKTLIPVSCTEQGRWHYTSNKFSDSDVIAAPKVRLYKNISVGKSLERDMSFYSDQGRVWSEIDSYHRSAGTDSSTGAMKDVFEEKKGNLEDYLNNFSTAEGQTGIFVFINGQTVGFDCISLSRAYKVLHKKIIKSYAIDALLENKNKDYNVSGGKAKDFIMKLEDANTKIFDSVGYGKDYRFKGNGVIASSLVWSESVIHMACFKSDDAGSKEDDFAGFEDNGLISSYRQRRRNK